MAFNSIITHACELTEPLRVTPLRHCLASGDRLGDRFEITVTRAGAPVPLDGGSVTGYFVREGDGATIPVPGEASGSVASVLLPEACYTVSGRFSLVVKATLGGARHAIYACEGAVLRSSTDVIVDPEHVIPDLQELLALVNQIDAAITDAKGAAAFIRGVTASATQIAPGGKPSAVASEAGDHLHIAFGLVKGDKGDPGSIENLTVCGVKPDSSNNIPLSASHLGALGYMGALSPGDDGSPVNFDDHTEIGLYWITTANAKEAINCPFPSAGVVEVLPAGNRKIQRMTCYGTAYAGHMAFRTQEVNAWNAWKEVATADLANADADQALRNLGAVWKAGDTYSMPSTGSPQSRLTYAAFVSNATKTIYLSIPVGKPITASGVAITALKGTLRGPGGQIESGTIDFLSGEYTVTTKIHGAVGVIQLEIVKSSAYANAENNIAIVASFTDFALAFS